MTFRVIDYTKNVWRINCGGVTQNSLPHQLHTSMCCVFWGAGGLQIRIDLLRNLGSKDAHGKLVFLGCVGSWGTKRCMRENGTICPFGVFLFLSFIFCVKIGRFAFKT